MPDYKLLQKFANSDNDKANREANQAVVQDELKKAQMGPDERAYYEFMQRQKMLNTQPQDSLIQKHDISPEQEKLQALEQMKFYNSPEAQTIRAQYDPDERNKLSAGILEPLQGAVDLTPRFPSLRKLVSK